MWVVTFYTADELPIEVKIKSAKNRTLAILAAVKEKPGVIDRSYDVDALELPDDEEGGTA
jgi:hypothetical protein